MDRLQWAIYEAVHAAGIKPLAEAMRVTPQVLINKVNPETQGHSLTLDQFLQVLEHADHAPILAALQDRAERAKGLAPRAASLINDVLEVAQEGGDVVSTFRDGAADGVWSEHDAQRYEKEAREAIDALGRSVSDSWQLARSGGRLSAVA